MTELCRPFRACIDLGAVHPGRRAPTRLPWAIVFRAFSRFSLSLVTSAATAFETFFNPIGLPLSYPGRDNGRTTNRVGNASKAPAQGASMGRLGEAGQLGGADGPCHRFLRHALRIATADPEFE